MTDRQNLLESVATTAADYRMGEIPPPTLQHVDRWVQQFEEPVQLPLLRELNHVLKKTYFSREIVSKFFAKQVKHEKIAGANPCDFWRTAHFLEIQKQGNSQADIRNLFGETLMSQCNIAIGDCGSDGGAFIYLDDALFSGSRIGNDLTSWVTESAPSFAVVHILVIAAHRLGEWQCLERLKKESATIGKRINFHCWAATRLENRKSYRNVSEVLWPATLPDDATLAAYMTHENKFPFQPRQPGGQVEHGIFSSEEGRQLLEREFLLAGMRIRSFSQNPSRSLRPLGFSAFGLGFGSMIVTFRNCPNNCPLALWWGDPKAASAHPFRKWYPLFPRKTYSKEVSFDDFTF
ncbi:MAG: hypothetical protein AB7S77_02010 [Desulfatirhabdiaceae bacterium]